MTVAYVDTSCLVALAFDEPGAREIAGPLADVERLVSSNLLEAEFRSACVREDVTAHPPLLDRLDWILPDRPLSAELGEVLALGYVRGADAWHLACGLYLANRPAALTFVTLDERQAAVARRLGFASL